MSNYYRMKANINLDAIRDNILTMKKCVMTDKKMLVVIKANAYGHGAVEVAQALDDLSDYYGVAFIDEALELRTAGILKPILILGHTDEKDFPMLIKYQITQTIYTYDQAKKLSDMVKPGEKVKIHIKIDTGMNRIGFPCVKESVDEIYNISQLPGLEVEGIFSHYFLADATDKSRAQEQLKRYVQMVRWLEKKGVEFSLRHISNSAGIMEMPNEETNMIRSGIATYGLYPSEEMDRDNCHLYPAMELKSHITYVKKVPAGETIGYGATYTTTRDQVIATVEVGYADGYPRALSNQGRMIVHGQYAPIVGRVCMDQTMIDVTQIDNVCVGDEVTLVGTQGFASISVEELADTTMRFNYEFVCNVNRRVPRVFFREGKVVSEKNYLLRLDSIE